MQRIDENTYIDDSLVTCAEYQLFIDEMREQGKYFQPDHWTFYQFPEGKAREPILGVRHSDAAAFCDWLTKRENGEWRYLLPTDVEAKKYPLKSPSVKMWGYWTSTSDEGFQFWANGFEYQDGILFYDNMTFTYPLSINLPRAYGFDISIKLDFIEKEITKALELFLPAFDLLEKTIINSLIRYRDFLRPGARKRYKELKLLLDSAYHGESGRDYQFGRALWANLDTNLIYKQAQVVYPEFTKTLISLYCLTLMKERLVGSYPAFEGIRLVKERTK